MSAFIIHNITFSPEDLEQLGTKEKFWFIYLDKNNQKWLFKYSRDGTGEHWSEKVAEQLCIALGIPHAIYELASSQGREGVITKNLAPKGYRLIMGNEVLHSHSPNEYPQTDSNSTVRVREHTVTRVLGFLQKAEVSPPEGFCTEEIARADEVFCGYLMLDALISNQDRHHENWAILLENETNKLTLSPTYDHAASLGREMRDDQKAERLSSRDNFRKVNYFVKKAKSELYKYKNDQKPLGTVQAFMLAVEKRARAKKYWLSKLDCLTIDEVIGIFDKLPEETISSISKKFAIEMIIENKKRLLENK